MTEIDAFLMQQTDAEPMKMVAPYTKQIEINLPGPNSGGRGVPLKLTADVVLWDNDNPDLDWFIYTWKHSCNGEAANPFGFFLLLDVIYYDDRGHMKNAAKVSTTFTSFCQGVETITFESVNTNNVPVRRSAPSVTLDRVPGPVVGGPDRGRVAAGARRPGAGEAAVTSGTRSARSRARLRRCRGAGSCESAGCGGRRSPHRRPTRPGSRAPPGSR
jgi:hypothetical protein